MSFSLIAICFQSFVHRFDNVRNHILFPYFQSSIPLFFLSDVFIGITDHQVKKEKQKNLYTARRAVYKNRYIHIPHANQ